MDDDEGNKNKRKLVDSPLQNMFDTSPSLTEFPPYKSFEETWRQQKQSDIKTMEPTPGFVPEQWDEILIRQLEDLLLENLTSIFQDIIKRVVGFGYSEVVAQRAIFRHGLNSTGEELVSNIVNDLQRGSDVDSTFIDDQYGAFVFENVQKLAEFTLLEMVNVVKEVKPSLSTVESMWRLLLCDFNVSQACTVEETRMPNGCLSSISSFVEDQRFNTRHFNPNVPGGSACPPESLNHGSLLKSPDTEHKIHVKKPGSSKKMQSDSASQTSSFKEKMNIHHKADNKKEYVRRKKSLIENLTQLSSGSRRKPSSSFELVMEKKMKPRSECVDTSSTIAQPKDKSEPEARQPPMGKARIKITARVDGPDGTTRFKVITPKTEVDFPTLLEMSAARGSSNEHVKKTTSNHEVNSSALPNIPAANESLKTHMNGTTMKLEGDSQPFQDLCNYYAQIPYDKSRGIYFPRNEKEEIILKLVHRAQKLENEVCGWTEWANQKVMQATHRLMKEKTELNALRQEKEEVEKFEREKQMLDENTKKRLLEMEGAVSNATGQVNKANITVERLIMENALLKKDLMASKLFGVQSEVRYQEALEREKTTLKSVESWEQQKTMLQEDLVLQKTKVVELQKTVQKAKGLENQIEARLKRETVIHETWNAQAASLKAEREQLETATKQAEAMMMQEAETYVKRHEENTVKLENEISTMKLKFDSLRIAALRQSIDGVYGSNRGNKELRCERECVMCLSNEMCVVFLPCAHMVLCTTCNEVHRNKGMNNCPSCRAIIDERIPIRFSH